MQVANLSALSDFLAHVDNDVSVWDVILAARANYLHSISTSTKMAFRVLGVDYELEGVSPHKVAATHRLLSELGIDWARSETHQALRVSSPEQFSLLFPDHPANAYLNTLVSKGYQLSIMPLVLAEFRRTNAQRVISKYVPPGDFFAVKQTDDPDPYMIWDWASIVTHELDGGQLAYVGTHKFPESLLANITY